MSDILKTAAGIAAVVPGGQIVAAALGIADALGAGDWLNKHILGDATGGTAQAVVSAVAAVTGGNTDGAALAGMSGDQKVTVQVQLAQIAAQREAVAQQAQAEAIKAAFSDTADARKMAATGGPLQWGSIVVSVVVMGLFGAVVLGDAPKPTADLMQVLYSAVTLVLGFWLGRSARDAGIDTALANSIPAHMAGKVGK